MENIVILLKTYEISFKTRRVRNLVQNIPKENSIVIKQNSMWAQI